MDLFDRDEDTCVIRKYRPKDDRLNFTTDIGILFKCISLNSKRTERELYKYVEKNLSRINGNPDISYYIRETTNIDDVVVDPKKIVGNEGDFMSFWKVLQEESKKEERITIVKAMKEKLTALSLEEVNEIIKKAE